ncbi:gp290 [Sphingomonas phage PAU]|uniref:gp290 n=1 Tax=Sphingomonas phage PAU TaxID=1150991 RepID=UPI00025734A1|nr:gp290 [Sphingomonas phage PAU]AFF28300.1 gp290 [Sphingomonas phage PAU]
MDSITNFSIILFLLIFISVVILLLVDRIPFKLRVILLLQIIFYSLFMLFHILFLTKTL